VNEREAAVVRRVFELVAAGHGFEAIAKLLRDEAAPSPRSLGWSATASARSSRETCTGAQVVYGKTKVIWPTRGEKSITLPVR
jgi:hypothetical protein